MRHGVAVGFQFSEPVEIPVAHSLTEAVKIGLFPAEGADAPQKIRNEFQILPVAGHPERLAETDGFERKLRLRVRNLFRIHRGSARKNRIRMMQSRRFQFSGFRMESVFLKGAEQTVIFDAG